MVAAPGAKACWPAVASPLTIAHVDTEQLFSGGQVQVFLLMEGLRERGIGSILCCQPGSVEERRAKDAGFAVETVRMPNDLALLAVPALASAFRRQRASLVHLHTGRANWLGGWAARLARLPAITTRRMDRPLRRGWLTRLTYERLTRRAAAISPAVAGVLTAAGMPPARIVTIPSAVDLAALAPQRPRAEVRAELGVHADAVLLLGLARLTRRKGFDVLLDALGAPALRDDARWTLVLAGDGEELPALRRAAADLGLAQRVRFPGRREDVADLLAAADLVVMPSRGEGLGVAALEAMAAGRPVLASRVGGLADAVAHDVTGLLVPPDDPAALGAALRRLLDDATLRARLAAAGPPRVEQHFSPHTMVDAYERLYRDVLAETRRAE